MGEWTLALDEPAAVDPERTGGKGAGLAMMARAGLPVPRGFVVLPEAMGVVLGETDGGPQVWSDASVRAEAARRADILRTAPLPGDLEADVRARLATLGDVPVAIRSSATGEDRVAHSAAGQHETFLWRRGPDEVLAAIRDCWASVHAHRAAVYRARTGAAPFGARAAVVVQAMADADVAGVAFTADPSTGVATLVAEMAAGSAPGVVGGSVVPQRVALSREGRVVRRGGDGAPLMDDAALSELARLALAAEEVLGLPADVEWAWSLERGFAMLQLRPITALGARGAGRHGVIWTQRFSGERWTEAATPLGWSIVAPVLERFTWWPWASRGYLHRSRMTRLVAGTPYFNITIFRHLLFKTPWTPTPEFVLELFPAEEREEWRRRRWLLPTPGLVALVVAEALLKARWRGHRWPWFTNPHDWRRLAPALERIAREADTRPATFAAATRELGVLREGLLRYVGVHVWSLLWANLFYQGLGVLLESAGGEPLLRRRASLVAGFGPENLTLRTNAAVWRLAATAHEDPDVERTLLGAASGAAARAALASQDSAGTRRFLAALDALLDRYGHRARATWEVFSPRWRDEPGAVLEMARGFLRAGISADPFLKDEEIAAARRDAERALGVALAALPGRRRAWLAPLTRWSLRNARTFSLLRENQRFVFDRLMAAIGDVCRAGARLLEREGRLADAGDAVFLEVDELLGLGEGRLSAPEAARRIAERRTERERAVHGWAPTFLFEDEARQTDEVPRGGLLRGVGVSPGRATGRVRIARTLEDVSRLEAGEILVVKATDPGWTPYFTTASGLVSELGGMLSHAAVVAREYGLPAVANIANATDVLRDGEEITVDGDAGTIARSARP